MARTTTRAGELAARLEAVNDDIITLVTGANDEQWRRQSTSEGWPVGVLAHHTALVQHFFTGVIEKLAATEPSATTLVSQDIDQINARHAQEFADLSLIHI